MKSRRGFILAVMLFSVLLLSSCVGVNKDQPEIPAEPQKVEENSPAPVPQETTGAVTAQTSQSVTPKPTKPAVTPRTEKPAAQEPGTSATPGAEKAAVHAVPESEKTAAEKPKTQTSVAQEAPALPVNHPEENEVVPLPDLPDTLEPVSGPERDENELPWIKD